MINSWYANVGKLKTKRRRRNYLFMHPTDAQRRQIANGDWVGIANAHGKVDTEVRLTDDLMEGVVAMTHGWGHGRSKGLRTASARPGVNCNLLLPSGPGSFDPCPIKPI